MCRMPRRGTLSLHLCGLLPNKPIDQNQEPGKNLEHVVIKINSKITQFIPYAGYLDRDQDREIDEEEGKR